MCFIKMFCVYGVLTLKKNKIFLALGESALLEAKAPRNMPLMSNLTNPEPHFLSLAHAPQVLIFFALIIPSPGTRRPWLSTCQSPARIIQTSQS